MKVLKRPRFLVMHAIRLFGLVAICIIKRPKPNSQFLQVAVTPTPWGLEWGEPVWIGWLADFETARQVARGALQLVGRGAVPPDVAKLREVVEASAAVFPGANLTPHAAVVARAEQKIDLLDRSLKTAQAAGHLAYFNAGYQDYRLRLAAHQGANRPVAMSYSAYRRNILADLLRASITNGCGIDPLQPVLENKY